MEKIRGWLGLCFKVDIFGPPSLDDMATMLICRPTTYSCIQGNHSSWKVMEFTKTIFQAWKVMENSHGHEKSWKVLENNDMKNAETPCSSRYLN